MVAQVIRDTRSAQGLSQEAFGAALGVRKQSVSAWEKGIRRPGYFTLLRWALKCSDWRRDLAFKCLAELKPDLY
jgi:transcriptional regulator with XRE-family HTH domain